MIKVNLLRNLAGASTASASSGAETLSPETQREAGLRIGIILLLPLLLYGYERIHMSQLEEQAAQLQGEISKTNAEKAKFGDAGPKIERYNKEKARVDQEMAVIRALSKNRLREVKALDALQSLVPGRTWLKSVHIDGNSIALNGFTGAEDGVTEFIHALENSVYFSRVEPKATSTETIGGAAIKKFELEFKVGKQE